MKVMILRSLMISLVLSALGLAWVVFQVGSLEDLYVIRRLPFGHLLAATSALLTSFIVAGVRLQYLVRPLGFRLKLRYAIRTHILGLFSATVTPGGSGNTPAIALMLQHHGHSSGQAWAAGIALFRADLIFHSWGMPVALAILYQQEVYPNGPGWLGLGLLSVVVAIILAFLLQS